MQPEFTIEVPSADAEAPIKAGQGPAASDFTLSLLSDLERQLGEDAAAMDAEREPTAPTSHHTADVPAPDTQLTDATPEAPAGLAAAAADGSSAAPLGALPPTLAAGVAGAGAGGATPTVPAAVAAAGGSPGGEEEDELAANLLSNMASWQTELDTFQSALRACMESRPVPGAVQGSPSTVDESGRGAARLMHSGPKGITGFRGVTQHKRTRRYEANVWMDHKQMYLGAFDVPEQAAHAHDIGALCSGKARAEALNFPLTDYDALMPMLYSLPHAQVVSSLRGYGRLPTARPPGGISSGRLYSSPSARGASTSARRARSVDTDDSDEGVEAPPRPRPRRARKVSASPASRSAAALPPLPPADWQAGLQLPAQQQQQQGVKAEVEAPPPGVAPVAAATGGEGAKSDAASLAAAQQAQLQALSAALMGGAQATSPLAAAAVPEPAPAAGGMATAAAAPPPPLAGARNPLPPAAAPFSAGASALGAFESALWRTMAISHTLPRPEGVQEGASHRPLHSGPKGQSGFKGVTLYKRCQRYNAHIWLGKQTHIGTFHTAEQAAVAHDVMELWRNAAAQGLNFANTGYADLLPLLGPLSEADALCALRNYSRSPSAAAAAAASGAASHVPGRSRVAGGPRQPAPSAGASTKSAAPELAAPPPPPPSLRRRHRKPQHGGGGGSGNKSDSSSGGSVPAQRQTAGSLMWYMLEQEKSADDEFGGEEEDPDFSPEDGEEEWQEEHARERHSSPSGEPLGFQPRGTRSVAAALAGQLPPEQAVVGVRPPRAGSSHRWGVAVSMRGQAAWFGRLDRQRTAVAADVVLLWRRLALAAAGEEDDKDAATAFNCPAACYEQDAALVEQLRRIKSPGQLCQFMAAVIPQDPPAAGAPGTAGAGAAAAALIAIPSRLPSKGAAAPVAAAPTPALAPGVLLGARKRKQQALLEEARAAKLQHMGPAPAAAAAAAAPAAAPQPTAGGGGAAEQPQGALAEAAAAVQQADPSNSDGMLAALQQLVAAGKGGRLLQEVVEGWGGYPLMQQQDLFGCLRFPVCNGDWDQLEGRLQVALDLASLF